MEEEVSQLRKLIEATVLDLAGGSQEMAEEKEDGQRPDR